MINLTNMKIPKKYVEAIELIEKDIDGYWVYTNPGWRMASTECHTASTDTIAQLWDDIRSIEKCDCEQCKKDGAA